MKPEKKPQIASTVVKSPLSGDEWRITWIADGVEVVVVGKC